MNNLKDALQFYDRVVAAPADEREAVGNDHYDYLLESARACETDFENLIGGLIAGTGSLWPAEVNDYCNILLNAVGIDEDHPRRNP